MLPFCRDLTTRFLELTNVHTDLMWELKLKFVNETFSGQIFLTGGIS